MDGINCRTIGFSLLPSELIQDIFLRLALPEIHRVKSVSKTLTPVITCKHFLREYNVRSVTDSWVFVYKKRSSLRDSVLYGFTDRLNRWFSIPVYGLLSGVVPPGDDLYFLTASGDFFLFASNRRQELIAVNFSLNTVKKIPSSLLGPRGTSSWRRSGLKLISGPPGSDRFRFLFAERYMNRPVLFEYNSESDTWRIVQTSGNQPCGDRSENVYLSVTHHGSESVILGVRPQLGLGDELPVILRPRFDNEGPEEGLAIGFSTGGGAIKRLHIHGDGCVAIIKLDKVAFTCIELWGLSLTGRNWEMISKVSNDLVERLKKPYGVMMGVLEERDGVIRVILVSNYKGLWDFIWLSYDMGKREWSWVPLPEFRTKGLNMAGIALSSGLTL